MAVKKEQNTEKDLKLWGGIKAVFSADTVLQVRIHWILRLSSALCFIGHGAWGVITKSGWLPFYGVFNVPHHLAWISMPVVGSIDILLGVLLIMRPIRFIMLYMAVWAVFTALLRPLAGFGWWEFLERGGNYGAPLAFLFLSGAAGPVKSWFSVVKEPLLSKTRTITLTWHLRIYTALLMIGHGGYGAFHQKEMLIDHFRSIGFKFLWVSPEIFITCFGLIEILLGFLVLFRPTRYLALFLVFWKLSTEFLYVIHGPFFWEIFEFIERWGSYGCPLALYFLLGTQEWKGKADTTLKERFNYVLVFIFLFIGFVVAVPKNILFKAQPKYPGISKHEPKKAGKEALPGEIFLPDFPVEKLKEGGYVIFMRHTPRDTTDDPEEEKMRNIHDRESVCSKPTRLNQKGIEYAQKIGEVIAALNIPKDEIILSPSCRTQEMKKIIFGTDNYMTMKEMLYIYARDPKIAPAHYNQVIMEVLTKPLYHGQNRFIFAHNNVIRQDTIGFAVDLDEGDSAVFKPTGEFGKFNPVGRINMKAWLDIKTK